MADKFCKDCKHVGGVPTAEFDPPCNAPQNIINNRDQAKYLVTGIEQPIRTMRRGNSCSALRLRRDEAMETLTCAPEGKWFEAKESAS